MDRTITLLHANTATWSVCQEEHPQECSQIRLDLTKVRWRTPSPSLHGTREGPMQHLPWAAGSTFASTISNTLQSSTVVCVMLRDTNRENRV